VIKFARLFLLWHARVISSARSLSAQRVPDELVDVGGAVHRSEEERLEHAAVDAEQRVEGEQQRRVAEFLRWMRSLYHFFQSLTSLGVYHVGHVSTLQRRSTCITKHIRTTVSLV